MRVGELFAGIGGIGLGLERAGMEVVWQVEKDDYCRRVLAKHWPDVKRYEDVKDVGAHNLEPVDLISGGFPCTDISSSGDKRGIKGEHSGLWREFARIICELRPAYVVVENVADLLHRGLGDVLGALAALGYDAEWDVLPACAFGAPQRRERVFVVAYTHTGGPDRLEERDGEGPDTLRGDYGDGLVVAQRSAAEAHTRVRRVDDGIPRWVDRLGSLGNAVVPQVAEYIGRRIMSADLTRSTTDER